MRKVLIALAAALVAAPALAQDAAPIKFGLFGPFTGQFSANGLRFREASLIGGSR